MITESTSVRNSDNNTINKDCKGKLGKKKKGRKTTLMDGLGRTTSGRENLEILYN